MASDQFISFNVKPSMAQMRETIRNMNPAVKIVILQRALVKSGFVVAEQSQKSMLSGRVGGAPPHPTRLTSRTGTGRRSIRSDRRASRRSRFGMFIDIGTDLGYMGLHEFGGPWRTPTGFRTYPPRPFLQPGLEKSKRQIEEIFRLEWARGIKRAGPVRK